MATIIDHIIVAIDLGTTYSGFAFSTGQQFKDKPSHVYAKNWPTSLGGSGKTFLYRVPCNLMLDVIFQYILTFYR